MSQTPTIHLPGRRPPARVILALLRLGTAHSTPVALASDREVAAATTPSRRTEARSSL